MKKFLCLILSLALAISILGCSSSKEKNEDNVPAEDVVTSVTNEAVTQEPEKTDEEIEVTETKEKAEEKDEEKTPEKKETEDEHGEKALDEKILDELTGTYLPVDFVDMISETRSLKEAQPLRLGLRIAKENDGSYNVDGGDLHQGGLELGNITSVEFKDGIYTLTSSPDNGGAYMIMSYAPGSDIVSVQKVGEGPFWYEGAKTINFYKYTNGKSEQQDIARMILGERENVSYKENGTYITIDGKEHKVEFLLSGVMTEPLETDLPSCDGYLVVINENGAGSVCGEYLIKGDKIQIAVPELGINIEI